MLRIGIQAVQGGGFLTLDVVPPVAGELLLIENGSIGAQERGSLISFATIVTGVIGLAAGFDVGIHSGDGGDVRTAETGVRNFVIDRIVHSGFAGDLAEVLFGLLGTLIGRVEFVRSVKGTVVVDLDGLDHAEHAHDGNERDF